MTNYRKITNRALAVGAVFTCFDWRMMMPRPSPIGLGPGGAVLHDVAQPLLQIQNPLSAALDLRDDVMAFLA